MSLAIELEIRRGLSTLVSYVYLQKENSSESGMELTELSSDWHVSAITRDQNDTENREKAAFLTFSHEPEGSVFSAKVPSVARFTSGKEGTFHQSATPGLLYNEQNLFEARLNDSHLASRVSLIYDSLLMPTYFLALIVLVCAFLLLLRYSVCSWWRRYNLRYAEDPSSPLLHLPLPPGSFGLPIIGETISWITQGSRFNSIRRKKYGNVFKTSAITLPMVKVTGHEYVKQVLQGEHINVTTVWPSVVRRLLGKNGIINSTGAEHHHKRRITFKAFSSSALNSYIPRLRKHVINNIQAMTSMERPRVYDQMLKLTYELGLSVLLGFNLGKNETKKSYKVFNDLVNNVFSIPYRIPGFGFDKGLQARSELLKDLQNQIRIKREAITEQILNGEDLSDANGSEPAALDIILREILQENFRKQEQTLRSQNDILNNNNANDITDGLKNVPEIDVESISDLALKEIAIELMFAGYHTSASSLASSILELARNPDVFHKVEEELLDHGLLTKDLHDDHVPEIDLQSIHKLTYLEQVLKETLRLRPPILGGYRRARKTFQLGEYRIPKGFYVIYNIRDTHEFEYEGMDNFDPDRFAPRKDAEEKYKFIPFGRGPRMCVGQQYARLIIKLTLIEMFRNFRKWELVGKNPLEMKSVPVLRPADGLPVKLFPREKVGVVVETC